MLKTLNFIRKLNKNNKKVIWLKTFHIREGKRKLLAPATMMNKVLKNCNNLILKDFKEII